MRRCWTQRNKLMLLLQVCKVCLCWIIACMFLGARDVHEAHALVHSSIFVVTTYTTMYIAALIVVHHSHKMLSASE